MTFQRVLVMVLLFCGLAMSIDLNDRIETSQQEIRAQHQEIEISQQEIRDHQQEIRDVQKEIDKRLMAFELEPTELKYFVSYECNNRRGNSQVSIPGCPPWGMHDIGIFA